ncbi:MAG: MGMT family protein [Nanoarchaeota archaeon]|nr:MGMT family protein [Nanoarchaeota archaeon]
MRFEKRVWQKCRLIPKGKVSSYKELAKALKTKAYRAVGNALKKNPYGAWQTKGKSCRRQRCFVPCHRVICSDGSLGGYQGKLNSKKKIQLLKKEGIKIKNKKIADFEKKFFRF